MVLHSLGLLAQDAISGYVNRTNADEWEEEVQLSKIKLKDLPDFSKTKLVATTTLGKDGYFSFKRVHIADKNTIYRLHVNRIQKIINDTIPNDKFFILSNKDSIQFPKGKEFFASYRNTNKADLEWQRLRKFETQLLNRSGSEDSISNAYLGNLKSYAKDSLQILIVKLIGIRQLDHKKLLDKDIVQNPRYYQSLLAELRESGLEPSQYLFLENKLAFLTMEAVEKKYRTSKLINVVLGILVSGLLVFIFLRRRRSVKGIGNLSRQEKNVQTLIVAGKTNKEIANELFISMSTVKTHITNIYSKLKVSNRQELLRKAQN
ncbi:MAG: helix-turn-helix transcriptional regulator [Bacteroidota bacterium]